MNEQQILDELIAAYKKRKAKSFIVDLSCYQLPGLQSVLAAVLCSKTALPTWILISASNSFNQKIIDFINNYSLHVSEIDMYETAIGNMIQRANQGWLAVGTLNKCEINWIRNYDHFSVIADILPFRNFNKSEIEEFYKVYINTDLEKLVLEKTPKISDIVNNYDFTYEELEWADRLNETSSILINEIDPSKDPKWFTYTSRQKKVIAKIHQIEKQTRFKALKLV
jgi:hypothetical protein